MKIHSTTKTPQFRTDRVIAQGEKGTFEAVRIANQDAGTVSRSLSAQRASGDSLQAQRVRGNGQVSGSAQVQTATGSASGAYAGDQDSFERGRSFDNVKGHGFSGSSQLNWERGEGATLEQQRTGPAGNTRSRSVEMSGEELKAYLTAQRLAAK